MSGHSKWSTIKRKKGAQDAARGKLFSKLTRLITTSITESGGINDPEKNIKLRLAISRAKSENMPKDTISRAISKATTTGGDSFKEIIYEAFNPDGVGLLIEANTDNSNRTHSEVKRIIESRGGKIGSPNTVLHLFTHCGIIIFNKHNIKEDIVFSLFDSLGGLDIESTNSQYIIYIPFEKIGSVHKYIEDNKPDNIAIYYKPVVTITLSEKQEQVLGDLMAELENLDDIQNVYANAS